MRRGRRPTPTNLKLLRGNPGKRRIEQSDPNPLALKNLRPPKWLDQFAREFWRRHAPELSRLGLLTVLDRDLLSAAAERWSTYRRACAETEETLSETSPANGRVIKPEIAIAKAALAECRTIMAEFGMSPAARTRVKAIPPKQINPLDEFLSRNPSRTFLA